MTPDSEREIRERVAAATPGPWIAREMLHYGEPGTGFGYVVGADGREILGAEDTAGSIEDARLTALLRNAAPELLDLIDAQRAELERLRAALNTARPVVEAAMLAALEDDDV